MLFLQVLFVCCVGSSCGAEMGSGGIVGSHAEVRELFGF